MALKLFTVESKASETLLAARSEDLKSLHATNKNLGQTFLHVNGSSAWRLVKLVTTADLEHSLAVRLVT